MSSPFRSAPRFRFLVVGGNAAGMTAAHQVRRLRPAWQVVVVEASPHVSVSTCSLPFLLSGEAARAEDLVVRDAAAHRSQGLEVWTDSRVVEIDPYNRRVVVEDGRGRRREPWDRLLLALGAEDLMPRLPGRDVAGWFHLSTLAGTVALRRWVETNRPRRAAVVGAGFTGLEAAEALARRGLEVHLIDAGPRVLPGLLVPSLAERLIEELGRLGVRCHFGAPLVALEGRSGRLGAVRTAAGRIDAEVAVMALGRRPRVHLAEAARVPLGPTGAIAVDRGQRTRREGIWAAGDCAESFHLVSRRACWMPMGTVANKQGRVAGRSVAGLDAHFKGVVGTRVLRVGELEVGLTGLGLDDARHLTPRLALGEVDSRTRSTLFADAAPLRVALIAGPPGRLLGAQIVGGPGTAKRIDAMAAALRGGLGLEDVEELDLAYAPPIGTTWDPWAIAARRARDNLRQEPR